MLISLNKNILNKNKTILDFQKNIQKNFIFSTHLNKSFISKNSTNLTNSNPLFLKIQKKNLFTKPNSDMREENPNALSLSNIYSFQSGRMKIHKNKIILGQNHLGLKTSRNDTFLIYQTEESNGFLIGKKLIFLGTIILLAILIQKYKAEGAFKIFTFSLLGGLAIFAIIQPGTNMSRNIRKIELNKSLNYLYVTLFNNKVLKVRNNDIYFNSNFRNFSQGNNKQLAIGIKGKNYYTSLRRSYVPNFDLFNCVIRGFNLGYDTQYKI